MMKSKIAVTKQIFDILKEDDIYVELRGVDREF